MVQEMINIKDFLQKAALSKTEWDVVIIDARMDICFASQQFAQMAGFVADDLAGMNIKDLNPKIWPKKPELFGENKSYRQLAFEFSKRNGDFVHLLFNGFQVEAESEKFAVLFWQDISKYALFERKYLSKEIELNTLIYKISHDLRGPIASSKGLINLVKIETSEKNVGDYVCLMDESLNKLDDKVKELAKVADLASGDHYYFSEIDVHDLIYNSLSDISKNYDVFDIVFDFNIQPGANFKTYEFALISVFSHMFIYCIENKSSDTGLVINLSVHIDNRHLYISLKDNGMGIEDKNIEKVFSPFYRINESYQSATLSLFTLKKSVEFLNGEINLRSRKNKGAEFNIKIPIYK